MEALSSELQACNARIAQLEKQLINEVTRAYKTTHKPGDLGTPLAKLEAKLSILDNDFKSFRGVDTRQVAESICSTFNQNLKKDVTKELEKFANGTLVSKLQDDVKRIDDFSRDIQVQFYRMKTHYEDFYSKAANKFNEEAWTNMENRLYETLESRCGKFEERLGAQLSNIKTTVEDKFNQIDTFLSTIDEKFATHMANLEQRLEKTQEELSNQQTQWLTTTYDRMNRRTQQVEHDMEDLKRSFTELQTTVKKEMETSSLKERFRYFESSIAEQERTIKGFFTQFETLQVAAEKNNEYQTKRQQEIMQTIKDTERNSQALILTVGQMKQDMRQQIQDWLQEREAELGIKFQEKTRFVDEFVNSMKKIRLDFLEEFNEVKQREKYAEFQKELEVKLQAMVQERDKYITNKADTLLQQNEAIQKMVEDQNAIVKMSEDKVNYYIGEEYQVKVLKRLEDKNRKAQEEWLQRRTQEFHTQFTNMSDVIKQELTNVVTQTEYMKSVVNDEKLLQFITAIEQKVSGRTEEWVRRKGDELDTRVMDMKTQMAEINTLAKAVEDKVYEMKAGQIQFEQDFQQKWTDAKWQEGIQRMTGEMNQYMKLVEKGIHSTNFDWKNQKTKEIDDIRALYETEIKKMSATYDTLHELWNEKKYQKEVLKLQKIITNMYKEQSDKVEQDVKELQTNFSSELQKVQNLYTYITSIWTEQRWAEGIELLKQDILKHKNILQKESDDRFESIQSYMMDQLYKVEKSNETIQSTWSDERLSSIIDQLNRETTQFVKVLEHRLSNTYAKTTQDLQQFNETRLTEINGSLQSQIGLVQASMRTFLDTWNEERWNQEVQKLSNKTFDLFLRLENDTKTDAETWKKEMLQEYRKLQTIVQSDKLKTQSMLQTLDAQYNPEKWQEAIDFITKGVKTEMEQAHEMFNTSNTEWQKIVMDTITMMEDNLQADMIRVNTLADTLEASWTHERWSKEMKEIRDYAKQLSKDMSSTFYKQTNDINELQKRMEDNILTQITNLHQNQQAIMELNLKTWNEQVEANYTKEQVSLQDFKTNLESSLRSSVESDLRTIRTNFYTEMKKLNELLVEQKAISSLFSETRWEEGVQKISKDVTYYIKAIEKSIRDSNTLQFQDYSNMLDTQVKTVNSLLEMVSNSSKQQTNTIDTAISNWNGRFETYYKDLETKVAEDLLKMETFKSNLETTIHKTVNTDLQTIRSTFNVEAKKIQDAIKACQAITALFSEERWEEGVQKITKDVTFYIKSLEKSIRDSNSLQFQNYQNTMEDFTGKFNTYTITLDSQIQQTNSILHNLTEQWNDTKWKNAMDALTKDLLYYIKSFEQGIRDSNTLQFQGYSTTLDNYSNVIKSMEKALIDTNDAQFQHIKAILEDYNLKYANYSDKVDTQIKVSKKTLETLTNQWNEKKWSETITLISNELLQTISKLEQGMRDSNTLQFQGYSTTMDNYATIIKEQTKLVKEQMSNVNFTLDNLQTQWNEQRWNDRIQIIETNVKDSVRNYEQIVLDKTKLLVQSYKNQIEATIDYFIKNIFTSNEIEYLKQFVHKATTNSTLQNQTYNQENYNDEQKPYNVEKRLINRGNNLEQQYDSYTKCFYTALFAKEGQNHDELSTVPQIPGWDFICFTNIDLPDNRGWKIVKVEEPYEDPVLSAKYYKWMSHKVLEDFDYVIWMDAHISPNLTSANTIKHWIITMIKEEVPIYHRRHKDRSCVWQECDAVLEAKRDTPEHVADVKVYLEQIQMPINWGLFDTNIMFKYNKDTTLQSLNEEVMKQLETMTIRDQLVVTPLYYKQQFKNFKQGNLLHAFTSNDTHVRIDAF